VNIGVMEKPLDIDLLVPESVEGIDGTGGAADV
jgi:hypothetical protein